MPHKPVLLRFRYVFNTLSDNTKSIAVFLAVLGGFLLAGIHTGFSWPGIILGCVIGCAIGYGCTILLRPIRRRNKV